MALSYTREIERAREEMTHHAADVAYMRREIQRLENVIARDLAIPVRVTAGLVEQLALRCGDALGPEGLMLLESLERSARHMRDVIDAAA